MDRCSKAASQFGRNFAVIIMLASAESATVQQNVLGNLVAQNFNLTFFV